jgi:XFP N-terminal domain
VLPILHLDAYKIANPTILGRMRDDELVSLFRGCGYPRTQAMRRKTMRGPARRSRPVVTLPSTSFSRLEI